MNVTCDGVDIDKMTSEELRFELKEVKKRLYKNILEFKNTIKNKDFTCDDAYSFHFAVECSYLFFNAIYEELDKRNDCTDEIIRIKTLAVKRIKGVVLI